jgi:enoyl-CoA hydratase
VSDVVLTDRERALGRITLNRPAKINALTREMIRLIDAALNRFEHDDRVRVVAIDGAGDRGFCAGGDIVALHGVAQAEDATFLRAFWREEYRLCARIARYPKPVITFMDGIVIGAGVGISAHASHRVGTERLVTAMPEVGIGFVPDVGGTFRLSRAPGELGTYLALTGERVGAADAILCGLVDHVVSSNSIASLLEQLSDGDADAALAATPPHEVGAGRLASARVWIDDAFGCAAVEEILHRLRLLPGPAPSAAAATIAANSPTSLTVALRALRQARELPSLEACLRQEYRTALAFITAPDFAEGIRAAMVDKDRTPHWDPATLDAVTPGSIDRFFAPLDGVDELQLAA